MPNYILKDLMYSSVHGSVWKGFRAPGSTDDRSMIYIAKKYCYEPQEFSSPMAAIQYITGVNHESAYC